MKRKWFEVRTYDILGPVRITYEFCGDINDSDFRNFTKNYIGKKEKDEYVLRPVPKNFYKQVYETLKSNPDLLKPVKIGHKDGCQIPDNK